MMATTCTLIVTLTKFLLKLVIFKPTQAYYAQFPYFWRKFDPNEYIHDRNSFR